MFLRKAKVIYFDSEQQVADKEEIEELSGKLSKSQEENKLMRSVLENDESTIDKGKLLTDSINQGMQSFTPDLMYDQLCKNYTLAKNIYGPSILKLASGYDPDYMKKNLRIPEFRKELKYQIEKNINELKEDGYLDSEYRITDTGLELASYVTYFEELDKLQPKGLIGEKEYKRQSHYGGKEDVKPFRSGDRFRDIAIKKSAKTAIRRGHTEIKKSDLTV